MEEREVDARDAELQRRVAMGERGPFEELYRLYAAPAYGLALRVTGHDLLAQEVVHDAFMALWSAPEAFDPARGTFRSFFLSPGPSPRSRHGPPGGPPAQTHGSSEPRAPRRRRRSGRRDPTTTGLPPDETMCSGPCAGFPPEQREVLELAYFSGMTQARIAELSGLPLGTVKTRTLAAMRKLRAMLESEGE